MGRLSIPARQWTETDVASWISVLPDGVLWREGAGMYDSMNRCNGVCFSRRVAALHEKLAMGGTTSLSILTHELRAGGLACRTARLRGCVSRAQHQRQAAAGADGREAADQPANVILWPPRRPAGASTPR